MTLSIRVIYSAMTYKFKLQNTNPNYPNVTDVPPQEVLSEKDKLILIDVRETSEYNAELGHITDSQLVVLATLPEKIPDIIKRSSESQKPIVFVCRSGARSGQACFFTSKYLSSELANENKSTQIGIYNMQGGMLMWNQLLLPVERNS